MLGRINMIINIISMTIMAISLGIIYSLAKDNKRLRRKIQELENGENYTNRLFEEDKK